MLTVSCSCRGKINTVDTLPPQIVGAPLAAPSFPEPVEREQKEVEQMESEWPFDQPKNCASLTLRSIVREGKPILYVVHYEDNHVWGFYDGEDVRQEDAMVVSLLSMVNRDASLLDVADLPPGWYAWREKPNAPWQRSLNADG